MKIVLRILLMSSFFMVLAAGLFGPIYAIFVEEIGGDLLTAGSAFAVFSIASGVLIYLIGKWEDSVHHQEKLLLFGRCLSVIAFGGYLFVQSPLHLFVVQIILGIASAVELPAYDSLYSKNLSKGRFASQWGTWEGMYGVVAGIAAISGGFIAQVFGFKILFVIMFIMSVMSMLIVLFLFKKIKLLLKNAIPKTR